MNVIISIGILVVVLGFIVGVHEAGHYWAMRCADITVKEIGLGLPSRIAKWEYRGVILSVNLIPLGAFVIPERDRDKAGCLFNKTTKQQALVYLAGPLVNLILGIGLLMLVNPTATLRIPYMIAQMIHGGKFGTEGLVGLVGAGQFIMELTSFLGGISLRVFIAILGAFSLGIGIVNLLPIMPLDGGRLAICLIEGIRGKLLSEGAVKRVTMAGMTLLLSVMLWVAYNDIARLITGETFELP